MRENNAVERRRVHTLGSLNLMRDAQWDIVNVNYMDAGRYAFTYDLALSIVRHEDDMSLFGCSIWDHSTDQEARVRKKFHL